MVAVECGELDLQRAQNPHCRISLASTTITDRKQSGKIARSARCALLHPPASPLHKLKLRLLKLQHRAALRVFSRVPLLDLVPLPTVKTKRFTRWIFPGYRNVNKTRLFASLLILKMGAKSFS
jgi:hypothetical protein